MPLRKKRFCTYQGCRTLTRDPKGRCERHPIESNWHKREAKLGNRHKRGYGNPLIISLDNIKTRESVQLLSNKKIFIQESQLPELKEGDFFYSEIVGMDVQDEKGVKLGRIRKILSTGSNDVYIMESVIESREILIPAIASVILSIDIEENLMIVCLPEWY